MSPRYLLLVGDELGEKAEIVQRLVRRTGLAVVFSNQRVTAFADASCRCLPVANDGCVMGWHFHRHGPARQVSCFTESEAASVAGSDGQALLSAFWGGYVAAISGADSVRILRDPSGNFPCYYSKGAGFTLFASDAALLVEAGVADLSIDCDEIGRQLYRAFVPAPATALGGINELLAGFALRLPGTGERQHPCWSPWDHVIDRSEDSEQIAERLFRVVAHNVQAWASTCSRVLLSVSGGLDSSIIAACLAEGPAEIVCLTMFTDDPSGDERPYARALCNHLGFQLIQRPYRLDDVDICEPLAANLPRPRDRTQAIAHERVHYAVASEIGADAFMTGNGGDNVFGYSQSAAPIADRYLSEGLGQGVAASLIDVCRQTGCSIFDALRQAWRLSRGSTRYRVRPNTLFLHPDFVAGLGRKELGHHWLDAPPHALPGKAAHVATILRAQPNLEPSGGTRYAVLNPLMSQPVIEACLAIPSWEWRAGGRDRSLARRAFKNELPPIVLDRRVKGTPSLFAARLLDHFRTPIRERLLGGRLAAHGVIDASAVEQMLAGERPVPDLERVRILELVNAEAWIDHWAARSQTSEPQ
jgi:asparagine synthase (glutamine-hydrolysing)